MVNSRNDTHTLHFGSRRNSCKTGHPPPGDPKADRAFEVETLLRRKTNRTGKRSYLVRWKGYGPEDDTWEPEEHLLQSTAASLVHDYKFTNNEFEVEALLKTRLNGSLLQDIHATKEDLMNHYKCAGSRKRSYLVRWKGYGPGEDTWEPEQNLLRSSAATLVHNYKQRNSTTKAGDMGAGTMATARESRRSPGSTACTACCKGKVKCVYVPQKKSCLLCTKRVTSRMYCMHLLILIELWCVSVQGVPCSLSVLREKIGKSSRASSKCNTCRNRCVRCASSPKPSLVRIVAMLMYYLDTMWTAMYVLTGEIVQSCKM